MLLLGWGAAAHARVLLLGAAARGPEALRPADWPEASGLLRARWAGNGSLWAAAPCLQVSYDEFVEFVLNYDEDGQEHSRP